MSRTRPRARSAPSSIRPGKGAGTVTRRAVVALALLLAGIAAAQAPPVDFTKFKPWTPSADEGDYLIAPPYANAPEITPRDNVPKGKVYRFTMNSTDSKLYPGISKAAPGQVVPYQRSVTV